MVENRGGNSDRSRPGKNHPAKKKSLLQLIGSIPGVLNIASLFYCAIDNSTPTFVRLFGLFALFYLAFPIDLIPDVLMLLFGLGALDDIAVLYMAYRLGVSHITPEHRKKALYLFDLNEADI